MQKAGSRAEESEDSQILVFFNLFYCSGIHIFELNIRSYKGHIYPVPIKNKFLLLIIVKVQFSSVLALNRRVLCIIVTNLFQTQFMQNNMHK